mgnify:CR=1 FL=1
MIISVLKRISGEGITYELCTDDMPVLGICLKVRILHQGVILEYGFPILLVLPVVGVLTHELLDGNLVAVEVLEDQVVEIACFVVFLELNVDVRLTRALRLRVHLVRNVVITLDDCELVLIGSHTSESTHHAAHGAARLHTVHY